MTGRTELSFRAAAENWLEALPIGNGRLGAMCWGGSPAVFDLNEETVWSGSPGSERSQRPLSASQTQALLGEAQGAVLSGDSARAAETLRRRQSSYAQAYLPVGRLWIDAGAEPGREAVAERGLDLSAAVHRTRCGDVVTETFASAPADVIVHAVSGEAVDALSVDFTSPLRELSRERSANSLAVTLAAPADVAPGHEPAFPAATWPDRAGATVEAAVVVRWRREAGRAVVIVAIETTYPGLGHRTFTPLREAVARAKAKVDAALAIEYAELRETHRVAHAELFGRAELRIDHEPREGTVQERLDAARRAPRGVLAHDPELAAVLFDVGRYLLISSSRPGGLPPTLQGIWNDSMRPPWSSAYTLNINTPMNQWPAEVTGLPETNEPLIRFVQALAAAGEETAAHDYGAPGWVAHHNSDAWAYTSTVGAGHGDPSWAFWPMAGPWLVLQLREHLAFGAAPAGFERDVLWPLACGAARFVLAWLCELPDGALGTVPSTSPENTFLDARGDITGVGVSSTMDIALCRDLLELAVRLDPGEDAHIAAEARAALDRLPRIEDRAGESGVLEWDRPVSEHDPRHRHLSHLYPLYPGTSHVGEAFERAAAVSLDRRGADSSGWSLAWKMALWARLARPDRVSELLSLFFRDARGLDGQWAGGLYPNLFAAHPPFQIDGNFGYVAALAECLLHSHRGRIELLPALPAELASGRVTGLVARPGIVVGIDWRDGELVRARLRARPGRGGEVHVSWRGRVVSVAVTEAAETTVTAAEILEGNRVEVH